MLRDESMIPSTVLMVVATFATTSQVSKRGNALYDLVHLVVH